MKKLLLVVPVVMILALALPASALAAGSGDARVVVGSDFTLDSGETQDGDLIVLGGSVLLEAGSQVMGSLFVIGGSVTADGTITGDVAVLGGNVVLGDQAVVNGNLNSLGGSVMREEGSVVEGQTSEGFVFDGGLVLPDLPDIPSVPNLESPTTPFSFFHGLSLSPVAKFVSLFFRTLIMGALAALVLSLWPRQSETMGQAVSGQLLASGGVGLLTIVAAPLVLVALAITFILAPLSLLGIVLLVAMGVLGWIVVGAEIGKRIAVAAKWNLQPVMTGTIGTLLLTFLVGGIGMISCFFWAGPVLIGAVGLGAVILTRFGTSAYTPAAPAPAAVETAEPRPAPKRSPKK